MIKIQVITVGPPVGPQLAANQAKIQQRIQGALTRASTKLGEEIVTKGRADISGAGRFGARWTAGLTFDVTGGETTRTVSIREAVPYWRVFQYGAIIHGNPLLWIPLQRGGGRARDYPGRLFRVDRKSGGVPLLLSADDKQVKYTGHESVRIPKKFHLVEIVRAETKTLGALFKLEMAS